MSSTSRMVLGPEAPRQDVDPVMALRTRPVTIVLGLLLAASLAYTGHVTFGLGGSGQSPLWNNWLYEATDELAVVLCLWRAFVGEDRLAWGTIGFALACNCFGDVYLDHVLASLSHPPYPSWADAGYLAMYPPLYIGLMLLIRARTSRLAASTWLEGVVGALALASVAATAVFDPVVASMHGAVAEVATNLAYPTFDVVLLALVAAGFALQGARAGRAWLLLGVGILLMGAGDAVYLVQTANGTYSNGSWVNATWPLANAMIAFAAWSRDPREARVAEDERGWAANLLSGFFALLIVGVLGVECFERTPLVAHVLLTLAILALFARLGLAGRERRQLARRTVEARTDDLTGLANRRSLYAAIELALAGSGAALLLLDLNRFKELNDTLGHNVGDDALCQLAARLQGALTADVLLARLGGDEFVALVPRVLGESDAVRVAHTLQDALEEPFCLDDLLVPLQASIGIALAPDHATTRAELLRCADVAMYRAKSRQTGIETYRQTSDGHTRDRLLLVSELRIALTRDQLVLHYQPKVALSDRRFVGVEVLVRWQHPRLGLLAPDEFVPLAEGEGLMRMLTLCVLDRALRQQRDWRRAGTDVPIAINLSPTDLLDVRLPAEIAAALQRYDTPPGLLELEITESTLMRDPERALDVIARIAELGVWFSLDDFGTGYSSLAQLKAAARSRAQDRSVVHHEHERQRGRREHRPLHDPDGPQPEAAHRRRGGRDSRASTRPRGIRVRHRTGLLPQQAGPRPSAHRMADREPICTVRT